MFELDYIQYVYRSLNVMKKRFRLISVRAFGRKDFTFKEIIYNTA